MRRLKTVWRSITVLGMDLGAGFRSLTVHFVDYARNRLRETMRLSAGSARRCRPPGAKTIAADEQVIRRCAGSPPSLPTEMRPSYGVQRMVAKAIEERVARHYTHSGAGT